MKNKKINIGIGFVTGRKNFRNVAKTYLNKWYESGTLDLKKYALHLFVAYDLKYTNTQAKDYQIIDEAILEMVDSVHYLGKSAIASEADALIERNIVTAKQAGLIFGEGYAMKRNAVLYFAMKHKMDQLIFLDDDEYPVANVKIGDKLVWEGQSVLETHVRYLEGVDMTNGHHCGYISTIPKMDFNDKFTEDDFRIFIEAISNDIINWESVKKKMDDGGITYAQLGRIENETMVEVEEVNGMKFISGANLGINLRNLDKLFPFYNPPGARGEDTFLSTCIGECRVMKVPCYTFHDGYSSYGGLLTGVLPNTLKMMRGSTASISKRFYKAAVGWTRYKPLLLYVTQKENYQEQIRVIRNQLELVIPKLCDFYGNEDFKVILSEFEHYCGHVEEHFKDFMNTKEAWLDVVLYLKETDLPKKTKIK